MLGVGNLGNLPSNVIEHALQWLDLRSHLRLREANSVSRKEVPRWTTTLVTRGCNAAQRCHDKILTGGKTFIRSITVDLSPKPSSSASSSFSYPTSLRNVCLDISAGHTLPLLVREHRPAEFRVHNMVHGGEFSGALLALEENLAPVRRDLRVLQLGLSTGGPRPYQDPRAHHWCMLRLRRLLGAAVGDSGGKVVRELAELTRALDTAVWHLVGVRFAERVESAASACGAADEVFLRKSCWPRLTELRLSCGIMGGDLEGLAECLGGNMPALEVLALEGHAFRAPPTHLTAFANALKLASTGSAYRSRLRTLSLSYFKVEGLAGLTLLGEVLSARRFPRLSELSIDSCRLVDSQLSVIAASLPGMSRTLKAVSFRSNYALSAEGISALAEVLRTGSVSTHRARRYRCTSGCEKSQEEEAECDEDRRINYQRSGVTPVAVVGNGEATSWTASSFAATNPAGPTRAPAWSVSPPAAASALMIESLDLSYSCWWRRPRRNALTGVAASPLTSLLKALGEGACPRLRSLGLAGCYFGDKVMGQLVAALESGCRALRVLDVTGNLFGEVGVRLVANALVCGRTAPHLRVVVMCNTKKPRYTELRAGMALGDASQTVDAWIEYQSNMQASSVRPNGATLVS